jgi:dTDP-D-glucose 4,6-dehydratase
MRKYGFKPTVSLKEGIRDTIVWYRTQRPPHAGYNIFEEGIKID